MAFCRTDKNGIVVEVIDFDPEGRFHPSIAWHACPDDTRQGAKLDNETGDLIENAPAVEPPEFSETPVVEPARRLLLTPAEFRNSFSAFEEVAIVDFAAGAEAEQDAQTKTIRRVVGVFFDRLKDPHLQTVDLADPRNLAGLDLLVGAGILPAERRETIARGLPT